MASPCGLEKHGSVLVENTVAEVPLTCPRKHLHLGSSNPYQCGLLGNKSFGFISEEELPSDVSCERNSLEAYHLIAPHEMRRPSAHQTAPLPPHLFTTHFATTLLGGCYMPSLAKLRRQWVQDYGVSQDQGIRSSMEDEHAALVEPDFAFFGVYDGHGGRQCAEYVREHFHLTLLNHPSFKSASRDAIRDAFALVEREFLGLSDGEQNSSGCVCAVALLQGDTLTVGNVGDCEVVLARAGEPVVLTVKHNPSCNDAEAARVKEAGGCIFNRRVGHPRLNPRMCSLAVSRAVGDAGFKLDEFTLGKPSGIIADADTCEVQLTPEDAFLLIACDGFWDTVCYGEAVQLCNELLASGLDANAVADKLVCEALMRGTRDNVTVLFVRLGL